MTLALASRARPAIEVRFDPELTARAQLNGLLDGEFSALGETHPIGNPVDWRSNPSADIEWLILLNKFYHAPGLVRAWRETGDTIWLDIWKAHSRSWIAAMEPGFIAADVTGRRLQNWVYALSLWQCAESGGDDAFADLINNSLADQADWLRNNLHPSRNHRTLELLALMLVAVWLGRSDDADWAIAALAANAEADFLPDGVHVELSSHYHCLALRNLIETKALAHANGIHVPQALTATIARASRFATALHKPDGMIPALSDADVGDYRAMLDAAIKPELVEVFPNAGYVILRDQAAVSGSPDGQFLVFDCGPIGAGNHGHLDCLSFEFAALGRSQVVDPGRFTYHEGGTFNHRAAFRGTAAHNLVQVDQREQTAYRQGPKRMKIAGPAPKVELLQAATNIVHARMQSHEYDVVNERIILRSEQGWWMIHDRLDSHEVHTYTSRLQLADHAQGLAHKMAFADGNAAISTPDMLVVPLASHSASLELEQGWIAPSYGLRLEAPRIAIELQATSAWFSVLLLPFRGALPDVAFGCDGRCWSVEIDGLASESGVLPC